MSANQGHTLSFRIITVKQENALAKTYELKLLNGEELPFRPGQFLTFIIHTGKQEIRRSYSILSLPGEPLKITVKKVENGAVSRYVLQYWKEGDTVISLHPTGRFVLEPQPAKPRDIFCFAAGSGIIPVLPQIRRLLTEEPQSTIHLIYSNHNETDALFLDETEALVQQYPALHLINFFSAPLYRLHEQGHLSNLSTEGLVRRYLQHEKEDTVFLLCGPFTYMRMLQITLGFMHFRKEQILKENYVPEVMRSGNVTHPVFPDRNIQLQIRQRQYTLKVPSGKDILSAAINHGVQLPYSCRGGVCGTCAAICKEGSVRMSINEVLTEQDLEQGWILTCTGYPETDRTLIEFS